jgi:DNA polymerase III sliding clamp (beta) subunit (PCNA family)
MHLNILKSDLLRLLDLARTFSDRDPPKPILRNALLSVVEAGEHQLLRVTASDLVQTVTVHAPCAAAELGAVAVSARALHDIVSTLPEGPVELHDDGTRVVVRAGRRTARIPFEVADDFPRMPEPDPEIPPAAIDASLLVSLIERVRRCASQDATNLHQCAVLLEIGDGQARAVALNASSAVAVATEPYAGEYGRVALVALKSIKRLQHALEKHSGRVLMHLAVSPDPNNAGLIFSFGSVQFACTRLDRDRYPNFEQIVGVDLPRSMRLPTKAIADVCAAGVKVLDRATEPAKAVFELADGELSVSVTSSTGRTYSDAIACVEHDGPAKWGMNLDILSEAIAPIGTESVEVQFQNESGLFRVVMPGDDSYMAMVAPCQM